MYIYGNECECIDANGNGICDDEETVAQSISLVDGWSMWSIFRQRMEIWNLYLQISLMI